MLPSALCFLVPHLGSPACVFLLLREATKMHFQLQIHSRTVKDGTFLCAAECLQEMYFAQELRTMYEFSVPLWSRMVLKKGQHGQYSELVICYFEIL